MTLPKLSPRRSFDRPFSLARSRSARRVPTRASLIRRSSLFLVLAGFLAACGDGSGLSDDGGSAGATTAPDDRNDGSMGGTGGTASDESGPDSGGSSMTPDATGCKAPTVDLDGECRIPCDVLPCESDHRNCMEATAESDAECGACQEGYAENDDGSCVISSCDPSAVGSIKRGCDVQRRRCVGEDGDAECGDCLDGYSAESGATTCRSQCDGDCDCPAGFGWHPTENSCFSCAGSALSCTGAGETGNVWALESRDGTACICETQQGYYTGSEGRTTFECDADGDGWLVDSAQTALESNNPVLRENARCERRTIRHFVLRSEDGSELENPVDLETMFPEDVEKGLAGGLPLYESDRNDGQASADALPGYGTGLSGRTFTPDEVTSLTRACTSSSGDLNHNGVADVEEWSESPLGPPVRDSTALRGYYAQYTAFSYWLELHDSWYSAPTARRGYPTYHIQERSRGETGAAGVGIAYPEDTSSYAHSCNRGVDVTYAGDPPNTIGGDFARFGDSAKMYHHSQFKCVQVVSNVTYAGGGYSESTHPHLVAQQDGRLERSTGADAMEDLDWTLNDCAVASDGSSGLAPADPTNPAMPPIECSVSDTVENGTVRWAAVNFSPYSSPYRGAEERGDYARGCFDQCVQSELEETSCESCSSDSEGRGVLGNVPAGTACGAGDVCDGSGQCGDCVPGNTRCNGSTLQTCLAGGTWSNATTCTFCLTIEPDEYATCRDCVPGDRDCSGDTPILCNSQGVWDSQTPCGSTKTCRDAGVCLADDGQECSVDRDCVSNRCVTYYHDDDGDGYGGRSGRYCGGTPPDGMVANDDDCCDSDELARPNQTDAFSSPNECGDYDYNCDTRESRTDTDVAYCNSSSSNDLGWMTSVPACGNSASYVTQWNFQWSSTTQTCYRPNWTQRTQTCR